MANFARLSMRFVGLPAAAGALLALIAGLREARADELPPASPPLAGYHQGAFFLRDAADTFRLYVQGRVHVDHLSSFGPGLGAMPPDQALKSGFSLRRARLEVGGELFQGMFQWDLSAEFGPTSVDNVGGRNAALDCTVDATTGAQTCATRSSAIETPAQRPAATDAWINWAADRALNLQVGQYFLPFSLENRLSENQTQFLERSLAVRLLGAPNTRDIGVSLWGEAEDTLLYYAVGIFGGDGPNRLNADSRYDVSGRVFARPLAREKESFLSRLQIGASARYGSRDHDYVGYDAPSLTTQGGHVFWRPTYRDASNRLVHVIPSGDQIAVAAELFVPLGKLDVTSELVYARSNTREALDGYQLTPFTERFGTFSGFGGYVMASYWILGDRSIIGYPGHSKPLHIDLTKPQKAPQYGVQLLTKVEELALSYDGSSRGGTADKMNSDGDIRVFALTLGANIWATRHLRFGVNYVYDMFPDSTPITPTVKGGLQQSSHQRAVAPAQYLPKGRNDGARDGAHSLHELHFRVGAQF